MGTGRKNPCSSQGISGVPASSTVGQWVCHGKCCFGVCSSLGLFSLDSSSKVAGRLQRRCAASCEAALLCFCLSFQQHLCLGKSQSQAPGCYCQAGFAAFVEDLHLLFCTLGMRLTGSLEGHCLIWWLLKSILTKWAGGGCSDYSICHLCHPRSAQTHLEPRLHCTWKWAWCDGARVVTTALYNCS